MPLRVWLSFVMLALGGALMLAAQIAGAAPERKGGIFRFGTTGASVQIDPQLSYISTGWWLEDATAAKLYNYTPTGKLVPEVASRHVVSNDGSRYTFFLRNGFRFSDGTRVTARNFKYAFDRVRNRELASPAAQFAGTGAVRAHGMKLVVYTSPRDGNLLSTLAMPFFQATSTRLPLDREVVDVNSRDDLPTAGPYAFVLNRLNQQTSLRRNPYWTPGPGRRAPRNLRGLDLYWNLNEQTAYDMVERGELDEGPIPAAEVQGVADRYGVNRGRFWSKAGPCLGFVAINNGSDLFRGNAALRRAVNWALDRTDYISTSTPYSKQPWTHLLPPDAPGSIVARRRQPYATRAQVDKARQIAAGHFRDGKITVYYRNSGAVNQAQAAIVKRDLTNLGFDEANITMKGFSGGNIYDAYGKIGNDADMAVGLGWCRDFPDVVQVFIPYSDHPPWFPDSPKYRSKIESVLRLKGEARNRALGRLDLEIMNHVAPLAAMNTYNSLYFFSDRVDPRSLKYNRVYHDWSIPALALK
jgi:ABC-type transport system substrate-binding protein